jgi:hypothetical protein
VLDPPDLGFPDRSGVGRLSRRQPSRSGTDGPCRRGEKGVPTGYRRWPAGAPDPTGRVGGNHVIAVTGRTDYLWIHLDLSPTALRPVYLHSETHMSYSTAVPGFLTAPTAPTASAAPAAPAALAAILVLAGCGSVVSSAPVVTDAHEKRRRRAERLRQPELEL